MAHSKQIIDLLDSRSRQTEIQAAASRRKVQREGGLQIQCVTWFRYQYMAFWKLLIHPRNEASRYTRRIAIDAAAGVVAGVPDLMLLLPSQDHSSEEPWLYYGLCIELKYGKTNNQSPAQREYQLFVEAAGYKYEVVRSFDEFKTVVSDYMSHVPCGVFKSVVDVGRLPKAAEQREKEKFYKIIGKK